MASSKPTEEKVTKTPAVTAAESTQAKKSNKTLIIVLVIVGVLFVLPGLLIALGGFWLSRGDNAEKISESIVQNATGADVDLNNNGSSVNIKTDDGSVSYKTDQKLPDNLPEAVYMYEGQTVVGALTSSKDGSSMWNISAETSDDASKVNEQIKSKYAENGWKTVSTATYNDTSTYSYEKDNLTNIISVGPASDAGKVSVVYSLRSSAD
jgi:hypothetical protein